MSSILVVDDDTVFCAAVEKMLKHLGHDVECITNAADAVAHFKRGAPDVTFVGLVMEDVNGLELTLQLKELDDEARIIGISNLHGYGLHMQRHGAQAMLHKPVTADALEAAIAAGG